MKQNKAVSVVMCTYNGASRHLREQLDSIFSQTVLPGEIVVQDDGSTDDTMAVLGEYATRHPMVCLCASIRMPHSKASTATSSRPCTVLPAS